MSPSTERSPARNSAMVKPALCQMPVMMMAQMAFLRSVVSANSKSAQPSPLTRNWMPAVGLYSHCQTVPVTMKLTARGYMYMVRQKLSARIFWSISSASNRPTSMVVST